jgi:cysteine desulfurase
VPAYLDHSASTPTRPEVVEAMLPHLGQLHANPSGAHRLARDARRAIDDARDVIASLLGAQPGEVVFTSGGTESDNLAVLGRLDRVGGRAVCSAIEHHAVADPVASRQGTTVAVDRRGVLDLDDLARRLRSAPDEAGPVTLVSIMTVNNELGTIQPLAAAAALVAELAPDAALHTDAVQAPAWLDVSGPAAGAQLISISGHKFGGPKGVGALVVRAGTDLAARQLGGGQERERRSGTPNVAGIVGMAVAAELAMAERPDLVERVGKLRDRLASGLAASVPGLVLTGEPGSLDDAGSAPAERIPGVCHVCIEGVDRESLLYLLEQHEVYASAGSSCASGASETSTVLAALGVDPALVQGALRLSLGWSSTEADVDLALEAIPAAVTRLRRFST